MTRRKIYCIENLENNCNQDGTAIPYLTYEKPNKKAGDIILSRGGTDATLEELVALCDHDAENQNAHDFCGSHRLLGAVLYRLVGRQLATAVMLDIAQRGGQHGMGGVGNGPIHGHSYKDLGVGKSGYDWDGSYGI